MGSNLSTCPLGIAACLSKNSFTDSKLKTCETSIILNTNLIYKYVVIFIFIYEWQSVRVCQNPNNAG